MLFYSTPLLLRSPGNLRTGGTVFRLRCRELLSEGKCFRGRAAEAQQFQPVFRFFDGWNHIRSCTPTGGHHLIKSIKVRRLQLLNAWFDHYIS